jgi:hypothetical protein
MQYLQRFVLKFPFAFKFDNLALFSVERFVKPFLILRLLPNPGFKFPHISS